VNRLDVLRTLGAFGLWAGVLIGVAFSQDSYGAANRVAIDRMHDRDVQMVLHPPSGKIGPETTPRFGITPE
jgi:hypothetical protein